MMTRTMGREPARSSTHDATHVHLKDEDAALRRSTETNYKSKVGNKLLKVEQIWYFIKFHVANPDVQHTKYMKAAIADGFATLSMLDKNDLIAYLTGKSATSDRIDVTVPVVMDEEGVGGADKRARWGTSARESACGEIEIQCCERPRTCRAC